MDTSDEWILKRTGISERRIASDDEVTSDMATAASKIAIKRAGLDSSESIWSSVPRSPPTILICPPPPVSSLINWELEEFKLLI